MAAPDISAVVALCNKAFDLESAGHVARAYDYKARALAAAQALAAPDCLIVARLQTGMAMSAFARASAPGIEGAQLAALCQSTFENVFAGAATLQRRKAAGTLLAGACRPAEEAWYEQARGHMLRAWREQNLNIGEEADAARLAPLLGYETLLMAADFAVMLAGSVARGELSLPPAQLRAALTLAADAVELMRQPRIHEEIPLGGEGMLVTSLRTLANDGLAERLLPHDAQGITQLMASLDTMERSGVLQRRDVDNALEKTKQLDKKLASAAATAAAAPGLRSCGLPRCGAREAHPQHFKSCAACRGVAYCCKQHQTEHWPSHKAACKAARKAAAEHAG